MLDMLGEAALRTLLLAAVVGCGLRLLRIRQPQLMLAAWSVVLAASIAMPMLARLAPLHVPVIPVFPTTLVDDADDVLASTALQTMPSEVPLEKRPQLSLRWWLQAIYVVVAVAIAARVLVGVALSLRLLAKSVPVHAEWVAGMCVRMSRKVATPVTVAHAILLPLDAESWSASTRRAVLAHERAHVLRWDFAMLVLAQLNRALFWFSPLSWWLHRRLVILSELASDDQAMAFTRDRVGYAEVLLEMGKRSGPVLREPAMAGLSTLASRIDRILDEPTSQQVHPSLRVVLTAAVAGLSLAAASLVPDPTRGSDIAPIPRQPITEGAAALGRPLLPTAEANLTQPRIKTERAPALKELPTPTALSVEPASAPEPLSRAPYVQQATVTPPAASVQRPLSGMRPPQLSSSKAVTHLTLALPPHPSPQNPGDQPLRNDTRAWVDSQSETDRRLPLPSIVIQAPPSLQRNLDLEQIMRSTCSGTIAVGMRARQSTQPNVVAGQTVEAKAQFFRRENGASWVRFFAFGRPPLDLPVRLFQGRITWTGEYGISYAVQPSGGDHLIGLAAQVAADSAQLEFTCSKPTVRTL